jgi:hypothetical protein
MTGQFRRICGNHRTMLDSGELSAKIHRLQRAEKPQYCLPLSVLFSCKDRFPIRRAAGSNDNLRNFVLRSLVDMLPFGHLLKGHLVLCPVWRSVSIRCTIHRCRP